VCSLFINNPVVNQTKIAATAKIKICPLIFLSMGNLHSKHIFIKRNSAIHILNRHIDMIQFHCGHMKNYKNMK